MVTISRWYGVVVAVACGVLLAGCVTDPADVPSSTPTSPPPLFESQDDALAAATEAYAGYMETTETVMEEGGVNIDRIDDYVSPEMSQIERDGIAEMVGAGRKFVGRSTFGPLLVQSYEPFTADGLGKIIVYVCVDISTGDLLDKEGVSVIDTSRELASTFEVSFDVNDERRTLQVAKAHQLSGVSVCG